MNDNFLCRVSFAGVPHTLEHINRISDANLYPISPEKLCQMYWLLSSLNIEYSYSINGVNVNRSFSVSSGIIPKNRLISPAVFYKSEYDPLFQTSYSANLDFLKIYFNANNLRNLGLSFSLSEADSFGLFWLGLEQKHGMSVVSRNFSFAGNSMTAYLCYSPSLVSTASFHNISITEQYVV
jgi:hypothetical protein